MLSTVMEAAESQHAPEYIFIKVMVLGLMAIISLFFLYTNIKNH